MVYFYWGLINRPVWCPQVLRCSVNGSNLPGQVDSQQGITIGLAGETGYQCCYNIMWSWKQPELMPFDHKTVLYRHFVAPHHPPPCAPLGVLMVLTTLWKLINYLKWRAFQPAIHWRVHPLNGLGWLQISGEMHTTCSMYSWDTV